jgi:hypothetical protein
VCWQTDDRGYRSTPPSGEYRNSKADFSAAPSGAQPRKTPPRHASASAGSRLSPTAMTASPAPCGSRRSASQQGVARFCEVWTYGAGWVTLMFERVAGAAALGTNGPEKLRGRGWIRMRIRCMKYKRIWKLDNRRLKRRHIQHMGFVTCREVYVSAR